MGYKKGQYLHDPKLYLPTREVNNSINCTNILYHIGVELRQMCSRRNEKFMNGNFLLALLYIAGRKPE